jgi:hypothetical protein
MSYVILSKLQKSKDIMFSSYSLPWFFTIHINLQNVIQSALVEKMIIQEDSKKIQIKHTWKLH